MNLSFSQNLTEFTKVLTHKFLKNYIYIYNILRILIGFNAKKKILIGG
jgi:hypothetical protein